MKTMLITTALALFAAPALAEDTVWKWGCEWKYGENGNYLTKVDGGCEHWIALGYATQAAMLKSPDAEEPSDEEDDEGEDPGDGGGEDNGHN